MPTSEGTASFLLRQDRMKHLQPETPLMSASQEKNLPPELQGFLKKHPEIRKKTKKSTIMESKKFRTHRYLWAEALYQTSNFLLLPGRISLWSLAYLIEPRPGKDKDKGSFWVRVFAFFGVVLSVILSPISGLFALAGLILRMIAHPFRPEMCFLNYETPKTETTSGKEEENDSTANIDLQTGLKIGTLNLALGMKSQGIVGDLRPAEERVQELAEYLNQLQDPPAVICLQEVFKGNRKKLYEAIKDRYPYILDNVSPSLVLNSGEVILSRVPIQNFYFERFKHLGTIDGLAPRGILKVDISLPQTDPNKKPAIIRVYNIHTEALLGHRRAISREKSIQQALNLIVQQYLEDRDQYGFIFPVLAGDFNASRFTVWGADHLLPQGQSEEKVLRSLLENFYTQENKEGPLGTWTNGVFSDKGLILTFKEKLDRWWHGYPDPKQTHTIHKTKWGTPDFDENDISPARLDHIAVPYVLLPDVFKKYHEYTGTKNLDENVLRVLHKQINTPKIIRSELKKEANETPTSRKDNISKELQTVGFFAETHTDIFNKKVQSHPTDHLPTWTTFKLQIIH